MISKIAIKPKAAAERNLPDRQLRMLAFLDKNPIGVLSTVTPDRSPHGVVIYFSIERTFTISFLTRSRTRKYDNLKHHSQVMLTVYDPITMTTVQVTGHATEVTATTEVNDVAGEVLGISLRTNHQGDLPITELEEAGRYVAFAIKPLQIRMAVYGRPEPGQYTDLFESIESFELRDTPGT